MSVKYFVIDQYNVLHIDIHIIIIQQNIYTHITKKSYESHAFQFYFLEYHIKKTMWL